MSDRNKRRVAWILGIAGNIALLVTWVFMEPNPYRIPSLIVASPFVLFALSMGLTGSFRGSVNLALILVPSFLKDAFRSDKKEISN